MHNHILPLTIEDNGIVFNHDLPRDGMGLQGLQSRVKAMNGKIEVAVETGKGVSAHLEFDVTDLMENCLKRLSNLN